jgi:hypothetical protein
MRRPVPLDPNIMTQPEPDCQKLDADGRAAPQPFKDYAASPAAIAQSDFRL